MLLILGKKKQQEKRVCFVLEDLPFKPHPLFPTHSLDFFDVCKIWESLRREKEILINSGLPNKTEMQIFGSPPLSLSVCV